MAYYNLGILDIIMILFSLLFSALIGVYYHFVSRDMETLQDYLLANKRGSKWSVSLSITATYFTAAAILSGPSETYSFGSQLLMIYFANVLLLPVIIYLYFPVFYKMQLISPYQYDKTTNDFYTLEEKLIENHVHYDESSEIHTYEYIFHAGTIYLEKRFNYSMRIFASSFSCVVSTFNSGITLYVPALTLETMTGFPVEWIIVIISITCTFYATISGIRGVNMTDTFQAIIFFGTLILILVTATIEKGGVLSVLESAYKGGRMQYFNFDTNPTVRYTFWNTMIGGGLGQLSFCITTETQVQHYMTLKSKKEAVQTIVISTIMILIFAILSQYAGLALFSIYEYCDPVESGQIKKYDELVILYILKKLSFIPGIVGLFISGIIAGSLSTISSNLNSMAAMIVEDFIKPIHLICFKSNYPESIALFYAKSVVIISSIFSVVAALSIRHTTSLAQVVIIMKLCSTSPMLALFTLGMFVHFCNAKGAIIGFLSSLILSIWIASGTPKPPPQRSPMSVENCNYSDLSNLMSSSLSNSTLSQVLNNQDYFIFYKMSFMWYSLFGFIPCIVVGIIVSLITNSERTFNSDNFELLTPPLANYLYKTRQKQNRCDINMTEMTEKDETGDDASTVML